MVRYYVRVVNRKKAAEIKKGGLPNPGLRPSLRIKVDRSETGKHGPNPKKNSERAPAAIKTGRA